MQRRGYGTVISAGLQGPKKNISNCIFAGGNELVCGAASFYFPFSRSQPNSANEREETRVAKPGVNGFILQKRNPNNNNNPPSVRSLNLKEIRHVIYPQATLRKKINKVFLEKKNESRPGEALITARGLGVVRHLFRAHYRAHITQLGVAVTVALFNELCVSVDGRWGGGAVTTLSNIVSLTRIKAPWLLMGGGILLRKRIASLIALSTAHSSISPLQAVDSSSGSGGFPSPHARCSN